MDYGGEMERRVSALEEQDRRREIQVTGWMAEEAAWRADVCTLMKSMDEWLTMTTAASAQCVQKIGDMCEAQQETRKVVEQAVAECKTMGVRLTHVEGVQKSLRTEGGVTAVTGAAIMQEVRGMRAEVTEVADKSRAEVRQMETTLRRNQEELHRDFPNVLREGLRKTLQNVTEREEDLSRCRGRGPWPHLEYLTPGAAPGYRNVPGCLARDRGRGRIPSWEDACPAHVYNRRRWLP